MTDIEIERAALALFEELLDVPEPERKAWIEARTGGNPKLKARLLAMLDADTRASLRTGAASDSMEPEAEPERIGAYRITGLIGRGGMGAVYRGERITGFSHVVAIKVIKAGLLSESLVERFRRERQTLAQLSHPNIARLYDGGETEDGAPYIVMEWIDGLPLLQYVEQTQAPLDQRLALFADMCRAVAFAHSHLIVHRDLTPSNVLVTKDASVKVIDFGIAKPADSEIRGGEATGGYSRPTAALSLTPGYAAPERLDSSEVTTAADIYSLGRLLEKLVGDNEELRAIVRRATAQKPGDRYATADALREDIEAFRAGRPVSAMTGGRAYVFRKFVSRHRYSVAAAVAAGLAIVVAFGLTLAANHRAELARAEAEKRYGETRAIANTLLFEVYDEVSKVPGATKARELLARTGVEYLEKLADDRTAPVAVRIEAGKGFVRLSQVAGGGQESNLGRYKDATALLAKGEAVLKAVYDQNPDNAEAGSAYASLLVEQAGNNLYNDSDSQKARQLAVRVQEMLKSRAASDPRLAGTYLAAIQTEGDSWLWEDNFATARDVLLRADAFYRSLKPEFRSDPAVLTGRSASLRLLGEAYHKLKQADLAKATLAENVAVNRERVRREPDNPKAVRGLILALRYSGIVHRTNMRDAEARSAIAESYGLVRDWRARDPADMGMLELVAGVGDVYAQVLTDQKQYEAAWAVSDEVIAAQRQRVKISGGAAFARRGLTTTLATRGGNFYNAGEYARACEAWEETRAGWEQLNRMGALSKTDRDNGYAEVKDMLKKACHPPRGGLGDAV